MKPRAWTGIGLGLLMLVLSGCPSGTPNAGNAPAGGEVTAFQMNAVLPDLKVKTLDGQEASLASFRGKITILDLFATWCPPCRMEIPHFVELASEHAGRVNVVGLSFDQDGPGAVKPFMQEMKINYPVFMGTEEIANYVGLRGIPHTLVLDAQGRVVRSYVGYRDKGVFEADIQALSNAVPLTPVPAK